MYVRLFEVESEILCHAKQLSDMGLLPEIVQEHFSGSMNLRRLYESKIQAQENAKK